MTKTKIAAAAAGLLLSLGAYAQQPTDQQIKDFFATNPTPDQIAVQAAALGMNESQISAAMGVAGYGGATQAARDATINSWVGNASNGFSWNAQGQLAQRQAAPAATQAQPDPVGVNQAVLGKGVWSPVERRWISDQELRGFAATNPSQDQMMQQAIKLGLNPQAIDYAAYVISGATSVMDPRAGSLTSSINRSIWSGQYGYGYSDSPTAQSEGLVAGNGNTQYKMPDGSYMTVRIHNGVPDQTYAQVLAGWNATNTAHPNCSMENGTLVCNAVDGLVPTCAVGERVVVQNDRAICLAANCELVAGMPSCHAIDQLPIDTSWQNGCYPSAASAPPGAPICNPALGLGTQQAGTSGSDATGALAGAAAGLAGSALSSAMGSMVPSGPCQAGQTMVTTYGIPKCVGTPTPFRATPGQGLANGLAGAAASLAAKAIGSPAVVAPPSSNTAAQTYKPNSAVAGDQTGFLLPAKDQSYHCKPGEIVAETGSGRLACETDTLSGTCQDGAGGPCNGGSQLRPTCKPGDRKLPDLAGTGGGINFMPPGPDSGYVSCDLTPNCAVDSSTGVVVCNPIDHLVPVCKAWQHVEADAAGNPVCVDQINILPPPDCGPGQVLQSIGGKYVCNGGDPYQPGGLGLGSGGPNPPSFGGNGGFSGPGLGAGGPNPPSFDGNGGLSGPGLGAGGPAPFVQ